MALSPELSKEMYRNMWRIRLFEEEANRQTSLGSVVGALHMYCGEEAVAVGVCGNLRDDDYVLGTHRSHGHCLAKGAESHRMIGGTFRQSHRNMRWKRRFDAQCRFLAQHARCQRHCRCWYCARHRCCTPSSCVEQIRYRYVSLVTALLHAAPFTKAMGLGLCGNSPLSMSVRTTSISSGCLV